MTSRRIILHESTQRSLCRLGFVLLGIAPLMLCVYLSTIALIPGYHRRLAASWENKLERTFGLTFRVGAAHELAPFRFRLDDVELLNPQSQKSIGQVRSIHLESGANDAWLIQLESPKLQLDQIADGCKTLHHWYVSRGQSLQQRSTIHADGLSICDGDEKLDLSELSIKVLPDSNRWGLSASFHVIPLQAKQPIDLSALPECHLLVARNYSKELASTDMQLHVPTQVPCSALAKLFELNNPTSFSLTNRISFLPSQFSGTLDVRFHEQRIDYYLKNATLSQVDIGRLSTGTETLLSGIGKLVVHQAKLNSSKLESADGYLEVGPGRMDSRFLQSLAVHLGFAIPRQQPIGLVGFDRLSAHFRIQPQMIQMIGAGNQGALLEDAHGAIAWKTDGSALPIISLIHALAFKPDNPIIPDRLSPLVRHALVWLPLDDIQRQQLARREP